METRSPRGQELHPKQEPPQSCKADSSTAESWRVLWSLSRKGKPGLFQHVGRCSLINGPGTEPPAASGLRVARVQPRPEAGQVAEQGGCRQTARHTRSNKLNLRAALPRPSCAQNPFLV